MIINAIKKWVSKHTDVKILIGTGTTVTDTEKKPVQAIRQLNTTKYVLSDKLGQFVIVDILKNPTGVTYQVLQVDTGNTFKIREEFFKLFFTK